MVDGLVLTRRTSERGVHETAQRGGSGAAAELARHYVGYEEWLESGFARREVARRGVALILGLGDPIDVYANGGDAEDSTPRSLGAFVVGNQSGSSMTGIGGHQLGVQIELTPAGALELFGGDVSLLNDEALPLDEVLGERGRRMVDHLADSSSWADRFDVLDRELARAAPGTPPDPTACPRFRRRSPGCVASSRPRVDGLGSSRSWTRRVGAAVT